jgi:hypothetical protein
VTPAHRLTLSLTLAFLSALGPLARAEDDGSAPEDTPSRRLGPFEIRDDHLLAQPRLTLPATTPDTLGRGRTSVQTSVLWSNSFGWTQDIPGEHPRDRRFLVDGETATFDLTVAHGFRENLDLGLRLPLQWRGGGSLDALIDTWHRILDLPDGNRPQFLRDAFRVEGLTTDHGAFSWDGDHGSGIGSLETFARWRFHRGPTWSSALLVRLGFPTGSGPFAGNGVGLGLQWTQARTLGRHFDAYVGLGGTLQSSGPVEGVGYEPTRAHAFAALEWRPARRLSLEVETDLASRLVKDIDRYPGVHWLINGGAAFALTRGSLLRAGFTENLMDQMATTDFALYFGIEIRPGARRGSPASSPP